MQRRENTFCKPSTGKAPCLSWKGNRAPLLAVFRRNSKVKIRQRRTKVSIHYILIANLINLPTSAKLLREYHPSLGPIYSVRVL